MLGLIFRIKLCRGSGFGPWPLNSLKGCIRFNDKNSATNDDMNKPVLEISMIRPGDKTTHGKKFGSVGNSSVINLTSTEMGAPDA